MKKMILMINIFLSLLNAQYITDDFVNEIDFTDSNLDSLLNIVYTQKSTRELISEGKIIVISFFNPG